MTEAKHHGRNIRSIRLLQGMKQSVFAAKMGVTQQYISQLESQEKLSSERLQKAAEILGVPIRAIEIFDENLLINSAIESGSEVPSTIRPMIDYFKNEILKRDLTIEKLEHELKKCLEIPTTPK